MKGTNGKFLISFVMAIALTGLILTPAFAATKFMNIATSRMGGAWYPMGEAFARMIEKYVPNTKANATTSAGAHENVRLMKSKRVDLALLTHNVAWGAYHGGGAYGEKYQELRILFNITSNHQQILATRKSGIQRIEDFKGKRIGEGPATSSIRDALDSILEVYGMTRKDFKALPFERRDRADALINGNIDAAFFSIGKGAAIMVEITSGHDVVFIEVPPEKVKEIQKKKPYYYPGIIKKEVYPKQLKSDYRTIEEGSSLTAPASMPDELVYQIVKAIWGHYDELVKMYPYFGKYTEKDQPLADTAGIPVHPGAAKFFREAGLMKK
jgi:TRAP transporter TAXI family solute receptor